MAILFFLPTLLSSLLVDAGTIFGFPLVFYGFGGYCAGPCPVFFSEFNLVIDVLVLIGVPFLVNFLALKKQLKSEKQ